MLIDDLSGHALFLDLDGTLIEIAPRPDEVYVPVGLLRALDSVARHLDGALAILTGRSIADVDRLLAPMTPISAGIHGAEVRYAAHGAIERKAGPIDHHIVELVRGIADREPGTLFEQKPASVAIHYRLAPHAEARIEAAVHRILDDGAEHLMICRGRKVLEIVPRHVSKGAALRSFMSLPAFRHRRPIMIGDDFTDISALNAASSLGGAGLRVAGEAFGAHELDFTGPAAVREWLALRGGNSD